MCGVCGLYGFADSEVPLGRMRRAMVHRGPDSEGSYDAVDVALGARRLAIIDLKTGGQPIYNEDRSMVIVSNGEIYNYREIARDLASRGHVFATRSDTEAILHAYEEFGPDCVERLDGMFAFAIWDSRRKRLLLARDRLGIKPLYFWRDGSRLAFASEVRALLVSGLVPRRLSRAGLESFLAYGAVQEPLTLVEGIHSLLPGHRLRVERGAVVVERYWDPPAGIAPFGVEDLPQVRGEVRTRLAEAVRSHLVSDVPVGVFLSSGIDSGGIVGLASEVTDRPLHSFTISFGEPEFDESQVAGITAKRWGTNHRLVPVTHTDVLRDLPETLASMDQPTVDGVNTWHVARAARQAEVTVVLSGLGGDELFCGYPTFREVPAMMRLDATWRRVPRPLRQAVSAVGNAVLPKTDRGRKLAAFMRGDVRFPHPYFAHRALFTPSQQQDLLPAAVRAASAEGAWFEKVSADLAQASRYDARGAVSYFELRNYMLCTLLRDVDCMSMAHSIEVRVPFLDYRLVSYVLGLPEALKVSRRGGSKPLLVGALGDVLAREPALQRKRTFTFPWAVWLRGALREEIEYTLLDAHGPLGAALNPRGVDAVWRRFLAGETSWARPWTLYVLARWLGAHLG